MLSSTGDNPTDTVAGLEANTLADGLFHSFTFVAALVGLFIVWGAMKRGAILSGRHLAGMMLTGWGLFNLVEGVVDHQVLTVHHVNYDNVALWDTAFLIFGALLVLAGLAMVRRGEHAEEAQVPL